MLRFLVLIAVVGLLAFAFTTPADPGSASSDRASRTDGAAGAEPDSKPSLLASLTSLASDSKDEPRAKSRATTQVYWQYIENGKVKFAPRLDDVPEAWRSKAGRVVLDGPPPDTPGAARIARERATAHVRLPSRRSAPHADGGGRGNGGGDYPEVVIYTTQSCPHCRKALAHLDRLGVPYENKDVENDRDAEEEYLKKGKGRRGVPLIDVGGEILRGYSPRSLDKALERNS